MNRRYNVLLLPEEIKILISLFNPVHQASIYTTLYDCVNYSFSRGRSILVYGLAKKTFMGWDEFRDSRGFRLHDESYWPQYHTHGPIISFTEYLQRAGVSLNA